MSNLKPKLMKSESCFWRYQRLSTCQKPAQSADDSKLQVSSLHYKAALLLDEVDRVNLELTNVEYANRFLVEVNETLCLGRWKKQKEMCTSAQSNINKWFIRSFRQHRRSHDTEYHLDQQLCFQIIISPFPLLAAVSDASKDDKENEREEVQPGKVSNILMNSSLRVLTRSLFKRSEIPLHSTQKQ